MPIMIKDFPKHPQKPLREFSDSLKKKKRRLPRRPRVSSNQTTYHLPLTERKNILTKHLPELKEKVKKYEKEFDKTTE